MSTINQYLTQIILMFILALAAWIGGQVRSLYRKYVTTEIKQSVRRTVVRFVEQVYIDLHGPEKLAKAMLRASDILKEYGIEISDKELISMIEAAVNEFNNSFGEDDAKGRHETAKPVPSEVLPDPEAYEAAMAETGGNATLDEIIADLKDEE